MDDREVTEEERTVFEGQEVDGYEIMFRQHRGPAEIPLALGEIVELKVIAKVKNVGHKEDQRSGLLFRHHELNVLDVSISSED